MFESSASVFEVSASVFESSVFESNVSMFESIESVFESSVFESSVFECEYVRVRVCSSASSKFTSVQKSRKYPTLQFQIQLNVDYRWVA